MDVLTAVMIAAHDHVGVPLDVMDYFVLLAPIASVVRCSFKTWERQPGLQLCAVLSMMDAAIAFAVRAERPNAGPSAGAFGVSAKTMN